MEKRLAEPIRILEIELLRLRHGLFAKQLQELGAGYAYRSRSSGWQANGQIEKHYTLHGGFTNNTNNNIVCWNMLKLMICPRFRNDQGTQGSCCPS